MCAGGEGGGAQWGAAHMTFEKPKRVSLQTQNGCLARASPLEGAVALVDIRALMPFDA